MKNQIQSPPILIDEKFAKLLVAMTEKVLWETFGTSIYLNSIMFTNENFSVTDVSSTISIIQDQMEGTLAFLFHKDTILGLLKKIYRVPLSDPERSCAEGVSEISNMVFSMMKADLNARGHSIKMALPNLILGQEHKVLTFLQGSKFIADFETPFGRFQMGVTASLP